MEPIQIRPDTLHTQIMQNFKPKGLAERFIYSTVIDPRLSTINRVINTVCLRIFEALFLIATVGIGYLLVKRLSQIEASYRNNIAAIYAKSQSISRSSLAPVVDCFTQLDEKKYPAAIASLKELRTHLDTLSGYDVVDDLMDILSVSAVDEGDLMALKEEYGKISVSPELARLPEQIIVKNKLGSTNDPLGIIEEYFLSEGDVVVAYEAALHIPLNEMRQLCLKEICIRACWLGRLDFSLTILPQLADPEACRKELFEALLSRRDFKEAEKLAENRKDLLEKLAFGLKNDGSLKEAERVAAKLKDSDLISLCIVEDYIEKGKLEEASRIKQKIKDFYYKEQASRALMKEWFKREDSVQALNAVQFLFSEDPDLLKKYAEGLVKMGAYQEARDLYRIHKGLKNSIEYAIRKRELGKSAESQVLEGKIADVLALANKSEDEERYILYRHAADTLMKEGCFQKAIEVNSRIPSDHRLRGKVFNEWIWKAMPFCVGKKDLLRDIQAIFNQDNREVAFAIASLFLRGGEKKRM